MVFDTKKGTKGLEESTFDVLQVKAFYNTRPWTILSYIWIWVLLLLKLAILGGDTYTCISLLAFNRWSSLEYTVYEYKIAKWIFAGCILFRIALLIYQILWAIHVFRTRNIALAYLNNYSRMMYAIRSYNYQCLFHQIDLEGFFEWACFFVYSQLDDALETLVADLPRQVINFMTLRFYATGGDMNNAILANISAIANTNVRLAVVLSIQLGSLVIFLFFFSQFVLAMLLFIPIKVKVSHKGFRLLKDICYHYVNSNVRYLVKKNHKLKNQLMAEGILDYKEIQENPLLASESSLDLNNIKNPYTRNYSPYGLSNASLNMSDVSLIQDHDYQRRPPPRSYTASSLRNEVNTLHSEEDPFSDPQKLSSQSQNPQTSLSQGSLSQGPAPQRPSGLSIVSDLPGITPVRPPPRTQTSSSLGLHLYGRKISENTLYLNSQPSLEHLYGQTEPTRSDISFSDDITSMRSHAYSSHPVSRRAPPPPPENIDQASSSPFNDSEKDKKRGSEDSSLPSITLSNEDAGSPYPLSDDVVEETPYPVRGVSQYLDDYSYSGRK